MSNVNKYSNYVKNHNLLENDTIEEIKEIVEVEDIDNLSEDEKKDDLSENIDNADNTDEEIDFEAEYAVNQELLTFKNKCNIYASDKKTSLISTFLTLGLYILEVFISGNKFGAWWFWLLSNILLVYSFALFKCSKDMDIGEIYRKQSKKLAINIICILIFGSIFILCV